MFPQILPRRVSRVTRFAPVVVGVPWEENPDAFHQQLAHFNLARIAPATPSNDWQAHMEQAHGLQIQEGHYLEALRQAIAGQLPPHTLDAHAFVAWFEQLQHVGPGQQHPLFDWLAHTADMAQMRWFLRQEAAGEAGFDDLVAYTQVKLPVRAKLECARNYWDEMGHGKQKAMHGEMLAHMVATLDLQPTIETTVWESLAVANTMLGLATTRRYAYHALGALGAIELTAPGRVGKVSAGMRRLGLDGQMRAYFDLHAALDKAHARAWISESIRPLVEADPSCARWLAEGALMRLLCGERCFVRYSAELGMPALH